MRGKERIIKRVNELQEQHVERHNIIVDNLTGKLESTHIHAMADDKGASAAVSYAMRIAKLHGLDVSRHEHGGSGKSNKVNDISRAEKSCVIGVALAEAVNS
jgi:hypothetical protein